MLRMEKTPYVKTKTWIALNKIYRSTDENYFFTFAR